eukprot:snap_masked-scaffold_3-processed-gene-7.27-mRNA-1 protein AED:1.00 eAED:1.00 QI:0/0/0/0/1/1/2/0/376
MSLLILRFLYRTTIALGITFLFFNSLILPKLVKLRYSRFYNPTQHDLDQFYSQFDLSNNQHYYRHSEEKNKDICLCLLTADRTYEDIKYILNSLIYGKKKKNVIINVFIYEDNQNLATAFDPKQTFQVYNITKPTEHQNCSSSVEIYKEFYLFKSALKKCLGSPYTLILEDDAFITNHYLEKLGKIFKFIEQEDFFLKLFVTDFWSGWSNTPQDIFSLVIFPLFFSTVTFYSLLYCKNRKFESLVIAVIEYILILVVLLLVGKQNTIFSEKNIFDFKLVPVPYFGASTVGTVISASANEKLFLHLDSISSQKICSTPIDLLVDEFTRKTSVSTYYVLPNLVEHTGVVSSKRKYSQSPLQRYKQAYKPSALFYSDYF